jgi:MFS family permease
MGSMGALATLDTVFGKLGFGYLADVVGRQKRYSFELIVAIVTGNGFVTDSHGVTLIRFRAVTHFGLLCSSVLLVLSVILVRRWSRALRNGRRTGRSLHRLRISIVGNRTDGSILSPPTPPTLATDSSCRLSWITGRQVMQQILVQYLHHIQTAWQWLRHGSVR